MTSPTLRWSTSTRPPLTLPTVRRPSRRVASSRSFAERAHWWLRAGALAKVIELVQPGARVADVCSAGDEFIENAVKTIYRQKGIEKGIAFPTCLSVNECAGHFSPLFSESTVLEEGDVVKMYAPPAAVAVDIVAREKPVLCRPQLHAMRERERERERERDHVAPASIND